MALAGVAHEGGRDFLAPVTLGSGGHGEEGEDRDEEVCSPAPKLPARLRASPLGSSQPEAGEARPLKLPADDSDADSCTAPETVAARGRGRRRGGRGGGRGGTGARGAAAAGAAGAGPSSGHGAAAPATAGAAGAGAGGLRVTRSRGGTVAGGAGRGNARRRSSSHTAPGPGPLSRAPSNSNEAAASEQAVAGTQPMEGGTYEGAGIGGKGGKEAGPAASNMAVTALELPGKAFQRVLANLTSLTTELSPGMTPSTISSLTGKGLQVCPGYWGCVCLCKGRVRPLAFWQHGCAAPKQLQPGYVRARCLGSGGQREGLGGGSGAGAGPRQSCGYRPTKDALTCATLLLLHVQA